MKLRGQKPFLLSYTLTYVSFTDEDRTCRVALREPMYLCTCVSEEGGDGEEEGDGGTTSSETPSLVCTFVSEEGDDGGTTCSETPSLLSYTLRYVSFTEVGSVCWVPL